jgi:hypothetical protein
MTRCTLLLLMLITFGATAETLTARQIMERTDQTMRQSNDNAFSRFKLTTCSYTIRNQRLGCTERPRIKEIENARILTGVDKLDSKSIAIVLQPAAEKGIGMLFYRYDDVNQDNETWMYLSALGKVKRIAGGSDDSASLFGSEITTEDQETGKLDDYQFTLQGEETFQGRKVWLIEAVPNQQRLAKSEYSKRVSWVDQERFLPLKGQMYDKQGRLSKQMVLNKVEQLDGVWLARNLTVMNLIDQRLTNMDIVEITLGVNVPEEFLSQRALTDPSFRERHLSVLRAQAKP